MQPSEELSLLWKSVTAKQ